MNVRLCSAAVLVAIRNSTTGLGGTSLQILASLEYIFLYLNTRHQLTYRQEIYMSLFIHQVCFNLAFLFFLLTFYFTSHKTVA